MKVLYICTHNRCRSILSEAITNYLSGDTLQARSAGSQPSGEVHPLSLKYLAEQNISIEGLTSQSWDEFENFSPDLVVTVCDSAAGESCPIWFGKSLKMHWGLEDPSKLASTDEEKAQAFRNTIDIIKQRVEQLANLAHLATDKTALQQALKELGAS
jgi:protein-tyrosine-phosphatase